MATNGFTHGPNNQKPLSSGPGKGYDRSAALVMKRIPHFLVLVLIVLFPARIRAAGPDGPTAVLELPPGPDNPRNSEGDFIQLKDGRIRFIYTHFTGSGGADNAPAHLAARDSSDGGRTWTTADALVLANEGGENIMSVSLERLPDQRIALLYLRKNSWTDCRPVLRYSADEGQTWSAPVGIIPDALVGYYVVNNDRLCVLKSGRLLLPSARHTDPARPKFHGDATILCWISDDSGKTWRSSRSERPSPQIDGKVVSLQEPGAVELSDGAVLLYCRTTGGSQFVTRSTDGGDTFGDFQPAPRLSSPTSPATIKRLPGKGGLLAVWNDHSQIDPSLRGRRTPLSAAVSLDDGATWSESRTLYNDPNGWYCYTALEVVGDAVLLGHCAGDRTTGNGLTHGRITRIPLTWFTDPLRKE